VVVRSKEGDIVVEYAIETNGLSVYYGRQRGILDVDLRVETGEVFGFLGPNGAGKTTTQRVLMDIIRPTAGEAHLFGLDCRKQGVAVRERVGYLPGELSLYESMQVRQFFEMYASLQKNHTERRHWQTLSERLQLDTRRKIGQLSRGNKQKVGVVTAFMNKPDLLILDEPTTGLDPLVQQTVMDLVREANQAGATVFFSSHILPEVQAVCDRVGIIRDGQLIATERVEDLTTQHFKRVRFRFATPPPAGAFAREGVTVLAQDGHNLTLEIYQDLDQVIKTAAALGIADLETIPVSLEEVFLAYYGQGNGGQDA
jgi:ABC-2 type transport system ATP-binding protein